MGFRDPMQRGVKNSEILYSLHVLIDVAFCATVCSLDDVTDRDLYITEVVMQIKDMTNEERELLVHAIEIAATSCERRAKDKGLPLSVVKGFMEQAEKYKMLRSSVTLTK